MPWIQIADAQSLIGTKLTFDDIVEEYAKEDAVYRQKLTVSYEIKQFFEKKTMFGKTEILILF